MSNINLKYLIGILAIIAVDSLVGIYYNDERRYDIYLFFDFDHEGRYLDNIMYDISKLFSFSVLTYFLRDLNKKMFEPLFITSLCVWVSYFLFYNQGSSIAIVPIWFILSVFYNKNKFK